MHPSTRILFFCFLSLVCEIIVGYFNFENERSGGGERTFSLSLFRCLEKQCKKKHTQKCKAEKKACGKTFKLAMEKSIEKVSDRRARSATKSNVHLNILHETNVFRITHRVF